MFYCFKEVDAFMNRFNLMHQMISVVLEAIVLYSVPVFQHVMRKEKTARVLVVFLVGFGVFFLSCPIKIVKYSCSLT